MMLGLDKIRPKEENTFSEKSGKSKLPKHGDIKIIEGNKWIYDAEAKPLPLWRYHQDAAKL